MFLSLDTADARLTIIDCVSNQSTVTIDQYLALDMNKKVLYNVVLPRLEANAIFRTYKITKRAQNAIAYVNAGFYVRLGRYGEVILSRICYGGINPDFTHAYGTETFLVGQELFTNNTLQSTIASLYNEINPNWNVPDAQPMYRKNLAIALFYRFVLSTCQPTSVGELYQSGATNLERSISSGYQSYKTFEKNWPLTRPVDKYEALQQTSGEVKFTNDIPRLDGELWAAFSVATKVHAKVVELNAKEALAMDGVRHFISSNDIPGQNNFTPRAPFMTVDELIFVPIGGRVQFNGQPVGMVLADTYEKAVRGAHMIKITYELSKSEGSTLMLMAKNMFKPLFEAIGNLNELKG